MANTKQTYDTILVIGMLGLGLILFILVNRGYTHLHDTCESKAIRGCMTAILTLSAAMVTAAVAYGFCMYQSGNCYSGSVASNDTAAVYFLLAAFIGMGLIACCSIMINELNAQIKNNDESCGGKKLLNIVIPMLVLSIVLTLATIYGSAWSSTSIIARLRGKSPIQASSSSAGLGGL